MRLKFAAPADSVTLQLTLLGQVVLVDVESGDAATACAHLAAAGITVSDEPSGGVRFDVAVLTKLAGLSDAVSCEADEALEPLMQLILCPPAPTQQALLDVGPAGRLRVGWVSDGVAWERELEDGAIAALLATDIPFSASPEAWDRARPAAETAMYAATCRVNLDGFIEVSASRPQAVERAAVTSLFRLDDTHFGVPLRHADQLTAEAGFSWSGRQPLLDDVLTVSPSFPSLAPHVESEAQELAKQLQLSSAAVINWPSGYGRRVAAISALTLLDAFPALVVCSAPQLWLWRRHAKLFGLEASLRAKDADIRVVTYRDLESGAAVPSTAALVFDDLSVEKVPSCNRLAGVADAYRLAMTADWPEKPQDQIAMMSVVRPVEFRPEVPAQIRYPLSPTARLQAHIGAYRRELAEVDGFSSSLFRRSSVKTVHPSREQKVAMLDVKGQFESGEASADDAMAEILQLSSTGTAHCISPKVAAVLETLESMPQEGSVCVASRYASTAELLEAVCRSWRPSRWLPGHLRPEGKLVLWAGFPLPDLRTFDTVIFVDYPRSFTEIEAAIGRAADVEGPQHVQFVHLEESPDDRLSVLAVMRSEGLPAPLPETDGRWSLDEASYVISA